ncbi:MAG TPA: DsrE family protein [Gemmatimonadales bacterium]
MNFLVVLNDPPYGTERSYNGLRLAGALAKRDGTAVKVFLLADAIGCAKAGQKVPQGYYHLGRMAQVVLQHGGQVGVCGSCMDARGLSEPDLIEGARRSALDELADWTLWADSVVVF